MTRRGTRGVRPYRKPENMPARETRCIIITTPEGRDVRVQADPNLSEHDANEIGKFMDYLHSESVKAKLFAKIEERKKERPA